MRMETEVWSSKLSQAYTRLLSDLYHNNALNEHLEEIDAHFLWLEEIADEAFKIFAVKCTKLEQMPKTPSMKQKGKRKARQKVEVLIEDENKQQGTPVAARALPTKLKFVSPRSVQAAEESFVYESSRPVRNCRVISKAVYVDENEIPKRSTRQTKKAKIDTGLNSPLADGEACVRETNSAIQIEAEKLGEIGKAKTYRSLVGKEKSGESPSVRERACAYESMLKQETNKSPVKGQHRTPNLMDKAENATKVATPKREISSSKSSSNLVSSGKASQSPRVESHVRHQSSSSKKSKLSSENDGSRAKTRLRLNKQKQPGQNLDVSKSLLSAEPDTASNNLTQHSQREHDRGLHKSDNIDSDGRPSCQDEGRDILNETETVITEVYEIQGKGLPAVLKESEMVQTKTTPVYEINRPQVTCVPVDSANDALGSVSDQGFNEGDEESANESPCESVDNTKSSDMKEKGPATRTRTRAKKDCEEPIPTTMDSKHSKDSGVSESTKANSTFVKVVASLESDVRPARTRARVQKDSCAGAADSTEPVTRTRQKKQDGASNISQDSKHTSVVVAEVGRAAALKDSPSAEGAGPATRTRQRKVEGAQSSSQDSKNIRAATVEAESTTKLELTSDAKPRLHKYAGATRLAMYGSDDEIVAGSPVIGTHKTSLRVPKKRLAEERGMSPRPKRSCMAVADQSCMSPLQTSSPIKHRGNYNDEELDRITSPIRSPRPFKFNSAQKKSSGFLNRTPGFGQNTSRLYSFLNNTPNCHSSGVLTSFLKRNTPPLKPNIQLLQEQKRQKLLEKENRDKERLKKAAELRKRKIDEQKRLRAEKEQKVAEAREMKMRNELEQKEKISKKLEVKAIVKEKLIEERTKEEREKQKQRLRKQMEADARRKIEEEERLKKLLEQEEEAKMHEEFMQRKKEYEEMERRRQIAEEKRRQEDRLMELEHKRQEEKARLKQIEEEKERERERIRLEREKQIAFERAERERIEREKREEKERKIQEEQEAIRAMEKERLLRQQEKIQNQKQEEAQQNAMKHLINKHNNTLSKQPSSNTSSSKINSYDMTPVKAKIVQKTNNPDNYNIEDHGSDDSTDDDQAPKKKIPEWAMGICLETALIKQHFNPPDLEAIFGIEQIEAPNLNLVFPRRRRSRFNKRTSSAVWNSPPVRK